MDDSQGGGKDVGGGIMAEGTVFSDKIIKHCPFRSGTIDERICDEEDCALWDGYFKQCKIFSALNTYTISMSRKKQEG